MNLEEALDLAAMDGVTIKKGVAVPDKNGNIVEPPVHITIHEHCPGEKSVKLVGFDNFIKYMEYRAEVETGVDEEAPIVDKRKHKTYSDIAEQDDNEIDTDDWLGPNADETWADLYDKD